MKLKVGRESKNLKKW